ncbi:MAG: hypothetical protein K2N11_05155 [Mucispirillum sp.]|nr:hypothetical protein [Mucispirillum sp.]
MKHKFNLKNTAVTIIAVFTIFFLAEYIFRRDYTILFVAVCFFSCLVLICLFIYLLLLFDNRYRLTYADADELSDDTKAKIIKENIKETKETQKNNHLKEMIYIIIYRQIYVLGFFELLLIIHFLLTDIENINKLLINTFPALFALIITVTDIIKKIRK